jgi:hypothetical protein
MVLLGDVHIKKFVPGMSYWVLQDIFCSGLFTWSEPHHFFPQNGHQGQNLPMGVLVSEMSILKAVGFKKFVVFK